MRKKREVYCRMRTTEDLLGFGDWPLIVVGIPFLGFFMPIVFMQMSFSEAVTCFIQEGIWTMAFTAIFWMGNRQITIFFRKRYPDHAQLKKRLFKQGLVIMLFTLATTFLLGSIQIHFGLYDHEMIKDVKKSFSQSFVMSIVATTLVVTIYEAVYFFNQWKASIAETEKLKKERITSQLEALRNQVNPHFLFNSLNTLASIIPDDPKKAVAFVQKMSTVYRGILALNERQVVTLREELETLEDYIFLVKTRFPENLHIHMAVQKEDLEKYVVPMSMQILVENAIKHNVISLKKPLHITIESRGDVVYVENNLQPKMHEEKGTKTGLKNIDNRNILSFERGIRVTETEQTFGVEIPLVIIEEK